MLLIVLRKLLNKEKVVLNVEKDIIMKIWIKMIENMRVLDFGYKSVKGEVDIKLMKWMNIEIITVIMIVEFKREINRVI